MALQATRVKDPFFMVFGGGAVFGVSQLYLYPVKSCAGIPVSRATVTETGFQYDRQWMVTDKDYKFLTQRQLGRLVLIQPTLSMTSAAPNDSRVPDSTGPKAMEGARFIISAGTGPGGNSDSGSPSLPTTVSIPLHPSPGHLAGLSLVHADVWGDLVPAYDEGNEVARWLSTFLERPVRLVRYAVEQASEASLANLNQRLPVPVDIRTFRPSILVGPGASPPEDPKHSPVAGMPPFIEETWRQITISPDSSSSSSTSPPSEHQRRVAAAGPEQHGPTTPLLVTSRCSRCVLTNTDPDTGVARPTHQPLRTLASYRRVDPGDKYRGCFGMNCVPIRVGQVISVGDIVSVQTTGEHRRVEIV
ncbi:hypothetical protein BJ085DRAFT_27503 [Dimargaris cristalligena]|uniref:MOSC domain-containing protein n=1 Tax=Dimargaris cristalligena TaxID=215637 RepID=A0A4Q0A2K7_9FUNG|nr:hypothetical protein BJ085DRAFT_27503 [Dimargaris cristalligena]|eukprot:RKP39761.1 hypothetical protein BJ085DRAFT_27503 [Dimargaris cristalligena]